MHLKMVCRYLLLFSFLGLAGCYKKTETPLYDIQKSATSTEAIVVSAHPLATSIGLEILRKGGTAADAAVAVQFALAVVYPRAGNIGGGGFLTYRNNNGEVFTLDYREKAPANASRDMYLDSAGNFIPGLSRHGIRAVGIPGSVAGLVETHRKFGRLRWSALLEPATRLAIRGYRVTSAEAKRLNDFKSQFQQHNPWPIPFVKKEPWNEGDLLIQEDLAATLQLIANHEHAGFYEGENVRYLVETVMSLDGLITQEDLFSYEAVWRKPISIQWRDYTFYTMGLPSSGGIILGQLLHMIGDRLEEDLGPRHVQNIHLIVEAERRAFADRALYLGDADFFYVPVDSIMSEAYLEGRFGDFDSSHASISGSVDSAVYHFTKESFETTHLSVVDSEGNAASVTTTLNDHYGSKVWVRGGGYFLNSEMDDFSSKPGVPNLFGLIGAKANAIAPNKRMLSTMTPTIVEKAGNLFMVVGARGGSTIVTSVLQVFLNHAVFDMSLDDAVQATRYHHQWLPDHILYETNAFSPSLIRSLDSLGHQIKEIKLIGAVEAISIDENGIMHGAADQSGDDHAAGL